jgi:hypothetical protein
LAVVVAHLEVELLELLYLVAQAEEEVVAQV